MTFSTTSRSFFIASFLLITSLALQSQTLAIFGSSVAKGTGDKEGTGGYATRISILMEAKGWKVVNVSKGGDNTVKILPRIHTDLLPSDPDFVIIGLSLGNEGIRTPDPIEQERIYEQFRTGLLNIIDSVIAMGARPIIMNCYSHGWFSTDHYQYTQRMNKWINQLPYPSVNVLGAQDNGSGNWPEGYENDPWHPNGKGHEEIFLAFVPTLPEALQAGKPTPKRAPESSYTRLQNKENDPAPITVDFTNTVHSFSTSFAFKAANDGVLLAIEAEEKSGILSIADGNLIYQSSSSPRLASVPINFHKWNYITIAHRYAQLETLVFLNGQQIARYREELQPRRIVLGGSGRSTSSIGVKQVDLSHWTIHRAALNEEEAKALYYHQFIQSSLEVYVPFTKPLGPNNILTNDAQSLTPVACKVSLLQLVNDLD